VSVSLPLSNASQSTQGTYTIFAYNNNGSVESAPAIVTVDVVTPKFGISRLFRAGIGYDLSRALPNALIDLGVAIYDDEIFQLGVTTNPSATYSWSYAPLKPGSFRVISSQTTAFFHFGAADVPRTPGYYMVTVNNNGKTTSMRFRILTFNHTLNAPFRYTPPALSITAKPVPITVQVGGIANFGVGVTGLPALFQWHQIDETGKDTLLKSSASPFLTINPVSTSSAGTFYAVVTDTLGRPSLETPHATLTVIPAGE
jgi:hypothetical protein